MHLYLAMRLIDARLSGVMHGNPCALWLFAGTVRCCSLLHGVEDPSTATELGETYCRILSL